MRLVGGQWLDKGAAAVGSPAVVPLSAAGDLSVVAVPGGGGTVTVEFSISDPVDIAAGNAVWFASTITAANAVAAALRDGPTTAVRITAATADATYEVAQRVH